jgi:hypothetical protein
LSRLPKSLEKNPPCRGVRSPRLGIGRLYPWPVGPDSAHSRFAERVIHGVGDDGVRQEILIWIERRAGAVWAVGRAIDPRNRAIPGPRPDDYVFEGYEMSDALEAANNAVSDDLEVSAGEGVEERVAPFTEEELLKPLERWFFGHSGASGRHGF